MSPERWQRTAPSDPALLSELQRLDLGLLRRADRDGGLPLLLISDERSARVLVRCAEHWWVAPATQSEGVPGWHWARDAEALTGEPGSFLLYSDYEDRGSGMGMHLLGMTVMLPGQGDRVCEAGSIRIAQGSYARAGPFEAADISRTFSPVSIVGLGCLEQEVLARWTLHAGRVRWGTMDLFAETRALEKGPPPHTKTRLRWTNGRIVAGECDSGPRAGTIRFSHVVHGREEGDVVATPSGAAVFSWFGLSGRPAIVEAFNAAGHRTLRHTVRPDGETLPRLLAASGSAVAVAAHEKTPTPPYQRVRIQVVGLDGVLRTEALVTGALGFDTLALDDDGTVRLRGEFAGELRAGGATLRSPRNPEGPRFAVYDRAEVRVAQNADVDLRLLDRGTDAPAAGNCAHPLCALPGVQVERVRGALRTRILPLRRPVQLGRRTLAPSTGRNTWLLLQFRGDELVLVERIEADGVDLDVFPDGDVLLLLVAFDHPVRIGDRPPMAAPEGGKSLVLARLGGPRNESGRQP